MNLKNMQKNSCRGDEMKLTPEEQEICDKYSAYDETGHVQCKKCPLVLDAKYCECYAAIDGRTKDARKLKRY